MNKAEMYQWLREHFSAEQIINMDDFTLASFIYEFWAAQIRAQAMDELDAKFNAYTYSCEIVDATHDWLEARRESAA